MFFFLPLQIIRPYKSIPYLTISLITINAIIFLGTIDYLEPIAKMFGFTVAANWWYTWFTSMFLHGDIFHLGFNMYFLWIFGSFLEDTIGRLRYSLIYLAGGIFSAVTNTLVVATVFPEAANIPTIGASGALAALMGVFAVRFLYYKVRIAYFVWIFIFIRWGTFELGSLAALLLWFSREVWSGALQLMEVVTGVAHWAHIGGFVFGLIWAMLARFEKEAKHENLIDEARDMANRDLSFQALNRYEQALKMDSENIDIIGEMAPMLAAEGQRNKATLYYRMAIPKMLATGKREKAAELAVDAVKRLGSLDEIQLEDREKYSIACIVEKNKHSNLAEILYRDIFSGSNEKLREMSLFRLGKLLQRLGRTEESSEIFRKFVQEFPNSEWGGFISLEIKGAV